MILCMLQKNTKRVCILFFEENTGELSKVVYKEAGSIWYQTQDSAVAEEVFKGIPGRPSDSDCGRQKTGRSGRKPGVYR